MQTTNLFVELLLIGLGAAVWLILFLCFFGLEPMTLVGLASKNQIVWAAIAIAILYILGILTDRLADQLFDKKNRKIMRRYYDSRSELLFDRTLIYKETSPLVDNIAYGRSRMRICRGWIFNLIFILLFSNIAFLFEWQGLQLFFLVNVSGVLLLAGFYFAWINLVKKEYEKVKGIGEIFRNNKL